jgi:hypothetical protein
MKYYEFISDSDRYDSLRLPSTGYTALDRFDGHLIANTWQPLDVDWFEIGDPSSDFPYLAGLVPVFTDRAWGALRPLVEKYVECLPLRNNSPERPSVFAIHVLPILDCLDPASAKLRQFDGRILSIQHYAFKAKQIAEIPIFRIQGYEFATVFINELFRARVETAGLRGLVFKPLP